MVRIDRANLALVLASVVVTLLATEGLLRLSGRASGIAHPGNPRRGAARRNGLFLDCYATDPRGYFDVVLSTAETRARYQAERVRGLEDSWRDFPHCVEYRYNSAGFRGKEFPSRWQTPDGKRAVVVGDSFAEGQGVREEDTSVRVLERELNRRQPGQWSVLNLGLRGTNFPKMMGLFEQAYELDPDVIVYSMVLNDADASQAYNARWPEFDDALMHVEQPIKLGFWDSRLVRFVSERLRAKRVSAESIRWYRARYGEPNREGWEQTKRRLRRVASRCRSLNVRFVVELWPLLVDLEADYPFAAIHKAIESFCVEAGIAFHDLLPDLRGHPTATLWVHPDDHHPNEVAHKIAALSLVPLIGDVPARPARAPAPPPAVSVDRELEEPTPAVVNFHSSRDSRESKAVPSTVAPPTPGRRGGEVRSFDEGPYVWIPAGVFMMGCTPGDTECYGDERPRRAVTLTHGYFMARTVVTVAQYRRSGVSMPSTRFHQSDDHPIVNVSWRAANAYCEAIGGRLPTEAEWERAARGGHDEWRYPWGNSIGHDDANYDGESGKDRWANTAPVGQFAPNDYGLFDMAGNVWQWTADSRALRGGSWFDDPWGLRVSSRVVVDTGSVNSTDGFRCVRDASVDR